MYNKNVELVDPAKVIAWEHHQTTPEHEERAAQGKQRPVPVFEMPRQYRDLGEYLLLDGHHRLEAALRQRVALPIIVINRPADLRYVPQYNDRESKGMGQDFFDMLKQDYIEHAVESLRSQK